MTTKKTASGPARGNQRRLERILALVALGLIALTWVVGADRAEADLMPAIQAAAPTADHVTRQENGLYAAWGDAAEQDLLGYVVIGTASGYGGPLEMAVAVDPAGTITGVAIANSKETPAWMTRVQDSRLIDSLTGKSYADSFELGADVDGVTGATYTSRGLAQAVLNGSQAAARVLGLPVTEAPAPAIQIGLPEIVLLALFGVGYVGHRRGFKYKKQARWASMLTGMVVLGFIYNAPLTLAYFAKLILGYWPQWQTNLYWYFLIGGILLVFTIDNKNPYCEWFCPFGAAQECLGALGGAKVRTPRQHRTWLKWLQRGLALAAILLGVFFRNPGLASYEVFGTLFGLVGTSLQFITLGLILFAALFIKRPWCTYLCPLNPVVEWVRVMREWVKELWQKVNPSRKAA